MKIPNRLRIKLSKVANFLNQTRFEITNLHEQTIKSEFASYYEKSRLEVSEILLERTNGHIFGGPFSAMKIPENIYYKQCPPLIVGSHEEELHETIYQIANIRIENCINIGAAEGYYAAGLAYLLPRCDIICFETQNIFHDTIQETARLNDLENRVRIENTCTIESLKNVITRRSLLLLDCEGAENELLDPKKIPELKSAFIICELHDFYISGLTRNIIDRFYLTHNFKIVEKRSRFFGKYSVLEGLTERQKWLAVHENRYVGNQRTQAKYIILEPNI